MELNASDERGIDVVRGKIKDFARSIGSGKVGFKIIFLDEADNLTADAQSALRRTMERYSRTCRFILSCNYSSKIVEPIQSRCVIFRFGHLSAKNIEERIREVAKKENVQVDDSAINAIVYVCEGDMRKAINVLQASASMRARSMMSKSKQSCMSSRPMSLEFWAAFWEPWPTPG
jgi:replication factor C small subunit